MLRVSKERKAVLTMIVSVVNIRSAWTDTNGVRWESVRSGAPRRVSGLTSTEVGMIRESESVADDRTPDDVESEWTV
jgi:hypothetical protein